jgi:hypothetical protein
LSFQETGLSVLTTGDVNGLTGPAEKPIFCGGGADVVVDDTATSFDGSTATVFEDSNCVRALTKREE